VRLDYVLDREAVGSRLLDVLLDAALRVDDRSLTV
jgi:hypothetical protein